MLRLLHMADVHLGARHDDLGPAASAQRERQFAAFKSALELALAEKVDLLLICGDLFDSNSQPRRSVERAAAELRRLVERNVATVIIPGTHDVYDSSSIYRAFDLPAMAGARPESDRLVVLTDKRGAVTYPRLDVTVHGRVSATKRADGSPLAGFSAAARAAGTSWQIGMVHGALLLPGKVENDDVIFSAEEVAASGLDYLALGHWHSHLQGRAGDTVWAYSGAPEPLALDQDGAGQVLLVTLEAKSGKKDVRIEPRQVGRTRIQRVDLEMADVGSQPELVRRLSAMADADLVADVRLVGIRSPELDLHLDEVEQELQSSFLRLRLRDLSQVIAEDAPPPPADTIAGAFVRDLEARIELASAEGDEARAAELREALNLGRLLLDEPERVTLA